jgi:hypothetical protein
MLVLTVFVVEVNPAPTVIVTVLGYLKITTPESPGDVASPLLEYDGVPPPPKLAAPAPAPR